MVEDTVEVVVNQFFHYCNSSQHTHLEISVGNNEYIRIQSADNKDKLKVFFVISDV